MPGMGELIVILLIVLVVFGANKLPGIGDALGRSIKNFKKASNVDDDEPSSRGRRSPGGSSRPAARRPRSSSDGDDDGEWEEVVVRRKKKKEARALTPAAGAALNSASTSAACLRSVSGASDRPRARRAPAARSVVAIRIASASGVDGFSTSARFTGVTHRPPRVRGDLRERLGNRRPRRRHLHDVVPR